MGGRGDQKEERPDSSRKTEARVPAGQRVPGGQEGGMHPGKGRGESTQAACGLESEPGAEAPSVSFHAGALEHV